MDAERWKRVDDLLQSALQVPAGQQEEFLRRACGDDAELRQEVSSLLRSHHQADSFLERPLIGMALRTPALEEEQEFVDHVTGRVVSHYRILSHLGHGGMGSVWLAERNDGRSGCATQAVVRLTDGTTALTLTVAAAANDSGVISQKYSSGAVMQIGVSVAGVDCGTAPAGADTSPNPKRGEAEGLFP